MIDQHWSIAPAWRGGFFWMAACQTTLWLAVGLLVSRLLQKHAARAHSALILATTAALISPILTATIRQMDWGVLPAREVKRPEPMPASDLIAGAAAPRLPDPGIQEPPPRARFEPTETRIGDQVTVGHQPLGASEPAPSAIEAPAAPAAQSWFLTLRDRQPIAIAAAWTICSLALFVRFAASFFAARRIVRQAIDETHPGLVAALCDASAALSVGRRPALRRSRIARCPMIWCWGRAIVLIPEDAAEPAALTWRSVFCHELAHWRRRDHWASLWAEVVLIAVPWQPLAWWGRRRLAALREQACDDWVLAVGGEATDYAESLVNLVPQGPSAYALAAVSTRKTLKRRLEHVLAGVRIAPTVGPRWIATATLLALAAVAGVGFAQQRSTAPRRGTNSSEEAISSKEVKQPPVEKQADGIAIVHGRVLKPDGQPAAGATVRAIKMTFSAYEERLPKHTQLAAAVADSKGEFSAGVNVRGLSEDQAKISLWATLPGYGLATKPLPAASEPAPIILQLVEDEPIHGRIMTLEGRPVPDARVEVVRFYESTKEAVDDWLASMSAKPGFMQFVTRDQPPEMGRSSRGEAVLRVRPAPVMSPNLLPSADTDSEGRFEVQGLGRDRLVHLVVTGPRIAAFGADVLTRPIKTIRFKFQETLGSHFEHVVGSSVGVEGIVTDEESGKPIPGAVVIPVDVNLPKTILQTDPFLAYHLSSTTDAGGHYRLEGLQTDSENWLKVVVPNLPYPTVERVTVSASASFAPIRQDIRLRRGVLAVGRAFDRVTGKPVSGRVYYTPFRSNKLARNYQRYRKPATDFLGNYPAGRADSEGRFRIPVVPGRGVVCLQCSTGDYRPNFGRAQIKEIADPRTMTKPRAAPTYDRLVPTTFHAVREINARPDALETEIDLPVDPGQNVLLKFVDARGQRLSGIDTYGLRLESRLTPGRRRAYVETDSATLVAASVDETRTLWFKHRATGLTKLIHFTPKAGETERTVVLEPPAVVVGRLASPEGAPVRDETIECVFDSNSPDRLPNVKTESDGHFRFELPAGGPYQLYSDPFPSAGIVEHLTIVAGEQVDLGEITVDRSSKVVRMPNVHRGPEKRTKPRHDAMMPVRTEARSDKTKEPTASDIRQSVSGRIVNEKREPVAGANVAVIVRKKSSGRIADIGTSGDILGEATTAGDGKFQLLVPRIESSQVWLCALIARAEGRALRWRHLSLDGPPITATLTLSNEQPIRGRFVDLQGQPLAGTRARVQGVMQVRNAPVPDGVGFMTSGVWPAAWPSAVVSDKTGRFAIHGIGAGLGVSLELEPTDKVAPQSVMINTGISEQRGKNDGTYRPQAIRNLTPGEEAILPLAPAQLFEGTVRLADTKQPAPHSRLTVHASQQAFGGSFVGVPGRADAQGHYRIIPRPGIQFYINAYPPDGMPYLISKMEHSWKSGDVKAHVDIDLPRGVLVRGTIVEADTNRPVPNCSIQYVPTQAAERKAPKGVVTGWQGIETSNARGEFAICVLPGLGHLLVHGPSADFVYQEIGGRELDQGRPGGQRHYSHAIERIDAKVDAASPINLTIKLKRGATITGRLLTPDNRPVEEALMMSRLQISDFSPTWRAFPETLRGGTFAVSGLAPGVEYPIYFLDQRRHLGATARLTANNDNPEPAIIRLAPCGKAKARFIDSDGKPIPDLEPNLYMVVTPGRFKFDPATYRLGQLAADEDFVQNIDRQNQTPSPKTDANGILTFKFLIPGAAYRVNGGRKGELAALKEFTAEADKTVDLGDIVADRPRER